MGQLADFKLALDVAAIVTVTDKTGRITHANDRFCQISMYSREELVGQNHRIIKSNVHPPEFFREMWRTISSGKVWKGEVCNRAKDGSLYWVNTTIVPFLDQAGKPYQYVSVRFDISPRLAAEEKLRAYAKRLEDSNQDLEHFASIAAHDLEEPLRKIRAFSDRLAVKTKDLLSPDDLDYLLRIQNAAVRMQDLINGLLSYSSLHLKPAGFAPVDLNRVAADVLSDLELRAEEAGGQITVAQLPCIVGDAQQLHQLLQNLIANAIKFRSPARPLQIEISARLEHPNCLLSVKDNGIGFDEKNLDRIFNIFQRLHGRTQYPGAGVGLAICRRIVERHNGSITAKSAPDQGAEFLVTLPIEQTKRAAGEGHGL